MGMQPLSHARGNLLKRLFDSVVYRAIYGLFFLLGLIPEKRAERIAESLGGFWYQLDRRHRKVSLENLELAFGKEMSQDQIVELKQKDRDFLDKEFRHDRAEVMTQGQLIVTVNA